MSDAVKTKRAYASPRRKQQAAETSSAILWAARELFVDQGWRATTIAAIAARAAVATETVYARFGTKRAILQGMVVAAMRGASPDTPFMEQSDRRAVTSQTDPEQMIEAFVTDISSVLERVAPVLAVVRTAATEDTEIKALYLDLHAARRRNLQSFVEQLNNVSGSRMRMSVEAATEHVWSVASPELYLLWMETASADSGRHRKWLAETIKAHVLRP